MAEAVDGEGNGDGLERLLDLAGKDRLDLVGSDFPVVASGRHRLGDPHGGGEPEIGAHQRVLELFKRRRVEPTLGEEAGDALGQG